MIEHRLDCLATRNRRVCGAICTNKNTEDKQGEF